MKVSVANGVFTITGTIEELTLKRSETSKKHYLTGTVQQRDPVFDYQGHPMVASRMQATVNILGVIPESKAVKRAATATSQDSAHSREQLLAELFA